MEDIQKSVNEILKEMHRLKVQVERLISDSESEKETHKRITSIIQRDIQKVENELRDIFYGKDRKSGIIVELDRLNQDAKQRQQNKKNIFALWVAVGGLIIKELLYFFMNDK